MLIIIRVNRNFSFQHQTQVSGRPHHPAAPMDLPLPMSSSLSNPTRTMPTTPTDSATPFSHYCLTSCTHTIPGEPYKGIIGRDLVSLRVLLVGRREVWFPIVATPMHTIKLTEVIFNLPYYCSYCFSSAVHRDIRNLSVSMLRQFSALQVR